MDLSRARAAVLGAGLGVSLLLVAEGLVRADERPSAQLDFAVEGAVVCPDEAAFRERVTTRLGYDPFVNAAATTVRVRFMARGAAVLARVDVATGGAPQGTRTLEGKKNACGALSDTVAAAVAMAIDPIGRGAVPAKAEPGPPTPAASVSAPEAPAPAPAAAPAASVAPPQRPAPVPHEGAPLALSLTFHGLGSLGAVPAPALGAIVGAGMRWSAFSIHAEGRVEATPTSAQVSPSDRLTGAAYGGALVPCGAVRALEACLGVRLGAVQATALDVDRPTLTTSFTSAVLARLVAQVPVAPRLTLRFGLEAGLPLVRTTFSVAGSPVWTAPAAYGTVLVGIGWLP